MTPSSVQSSQIEGDARVDRQDASTKTLESSSKGRRAEHRSGLHPKTKKGKGRKPASTVDDQDIDTPGSKSKSAAAQKTERRNPKSQAMLFPNITPDDIKAVLDDVSQKREKMESRWEENWIST